MTLERRVMGKYKDGALALTMYRAGAWLWFWEPLPAVHREVMGEDRG